MGTADEIGRAFQLLKPVLNERTRRLLAAACAEAIGYGGIAEVAQVTGVARSTIGRGLEELAELQSQPSLPAAEQRIRRPGGGSKPLTERDPTLSRDLEALVEPTTRGDPESALRWSCKSTRQLARELQAQGHRISHETVSQLLDGLGYSLQGLHKTKEGEQHPDRDTPFA